MWIAIFFLSRDEKEREEESQSGRGEMGWRQLKGRAKARQMM